MTLHIPLSADDETRLRERAAQAGKDLASLVREAVEELIKRGSDSTAPRAISHEEWSREWRAWAAGHKPVNHFVDDSRESIYAGRGE